jgi:hypothetical protein
MALPEAALRLLGVRDRGDDPALSAGTRALRGAVRSVRPRRRASGVADVAQPPSSRSGGADVPSCRRAAARRASERPRRRRRRGDAPPSDAGGARRDPIATTGWRGR